MKDNINEIITSKCYLTIYQLSPQHIQVIYATSVLIKLFRSHPLTMFGSQLPYLAK
jgi:hypothetical protein